MLAKAMATAFMMSNTPVQCAIASKPTPINNQNTYYLVGDVFQNTIYDDSYDIGWLI